MSRSFRKTPIFGITTVVSEKRDKRLANRAHRRACHELEAELAPDPEFPLVRETSNVWSFGKDGKRYWQSVDPADMRK